MSIPIPPTDDELFEMAFDALVPFANMGIITDEVKQEDIKRAREVLRFISTRITVTKTKAKHGSI